jgi:hypothetical protein
VGRQRRAGPDRLPRKPETRLRDLCGKEATSRERLSTENGLAFPHLRTLHLNIS